MTFIPCYSLNSPQAVTYVPEHRIKRVIVTTDGTMEVLTEDGKFLKAIIDGVPTDSIKTLYSTAQMTLAKLNSKE